MVHLFLHDNNLTDNTLSFVSANRMFLQKDFHILLSSCHPNNFFV